MRTVSELDPLSGARSRFLEAWLEESDQESPGRSPAGLRGHEGYEHDQEHGLEGREESWSARGAFTWKSPPENALQGLQGRVLSEHELRVQRSLQQLNVPDWYKNSNRPAEGFLLKRGSDAGNAAGRRGAGGWPGLGVKTTSLSSLRSPTTAVRLGSSPSPPPAAFTRWSSSRLHSGPGSASATPSTSPSGSARSSFNHRQPYLGWRSQERLSGTPRTPAERLAQTLLDQREQQRQRQQQQLQHERLTGSNQLKSSSPNLSDVRSSIKEVTSAIVHYVDQRANGPGYTSTTDVRLSATAPSGQAINDHRGSANATTGSPRVCWIESSFVGSRPIEQPQTPDESVVSASTSPLPLSHQDLYLDLQQRSAARTPCPNNGHPQQPAQLAQLAQTHQTHGPGADPPGRPWRGVAASSPSPSSPEPAVYMPYGAVSRPSPTSTTMEDVLDSLLGLPPPSRSPSPGPNTAAAAASTHQVQHSQHQQPSLRSCADIRPDPAGSASSGWGLHGVPGAPTPGKEDADGDPDEERPAGWEASDLAGTATTAAAEIPLTLPEDPRANDGAPTPPVVAPPGWRGTVVVGVLTEEPADESLRPDGDRNGGFCDTNCSEEAEFGAALLSMPLDPVRSVPGAPTPRRRRSESCAMESIDTGSGGLGVKGSRYCRNHGRPRRVSFDLSAAGGGAGGALEDEPGTVACRRVGCGRVAPEASARLRFKTCHNCAHTYCSRECRREHWDSHKRACAVQRVGGLLRRVVAQVRAEAGDTEALTTTARRGFAAHGRGLVRFLFHSLDAAEAYVAGEAPAGSAAAGQELVFVRLSDLPAGELGGSLYQDVTRLVHAYNPRTRAVVLVVLEVLSEAPSDDGVVMWERQLVSRVFKVHLFQEEHADKTLILEGVLAGLDGDSRSNRSNVLRKIIKALGQRGVDLRDDERGEANGEAFERVQEYIDQSLGCLGAAGTASTLTVDLQLQSGGRVVVILVPDTASELLDSAPAENTETVDVSG